MVALLLRDPWNKSIAEVSRLTDKQIVCLLMRPGDRKAAKKGYYWPVPDACDEVEHEAVTTEWTYRDLFFKIWRERGKDEKVIEQEFWAANPYYGRPLTAEGEGVGDGQ